MIPISAKSTKQSMGHSWVRAIASIEREIGRSQGSANSAHDSLTWSIKDDIEPMAGRMDTARHIIETPSGHTVVQRWFPNTGCSGCGTATSPLPDKLRPEWSTHLSYSGAAK